MNRSICGADCANCPSQKLCKGCATTKGCPFGKQCFIAKYIEVGGKEKYIDFVRTLVDEFNALNISGMSKIDGLYALCGSFVNLEYPLPNGETVKFLDDACIYLGNQVECEFGTNRCFGLVAGMDFLLVCQYGENGSNPEIVLYKKR